MSESFPTRMSLGVKCRWCGFTKPNYGKCESCGRKSNTWSAMRPKGYVPRTRAAAAKPQVPKPLGSVITAANYKPTALAELLLRSARS